MPLFRTLTLTSAIALAAGPALAEVTPTEIWDDWQSLLANYGAEVSFDRTSNQGDSLSIIGLTAEFAVVDGSSSWDIGTLTFNGNSDGSVTVVMEDEMALTIAMSGPEDQEGSVGMTMRMPGAEIIASGSMDALRYDFDYPTIELTEFTIEGDDVPDDIPVEISIAMSALDGFLEFTDPDTRAYISENTIALITMAMAFQGETAEQGAGAFNLTMKDLNQTTTGTMGTIAANMSMAQMIEAGTRQVGTGTHGEVTYDFNIDTPDGSFQMAAAAMSGEISGAITDSGISYGGTTNDVTMSISGSTIPLPPLTFKMAETGGTFAIPLVPGDDAQPFALAFKIAGLEIDDMLWGMVDPVGQLPRDPINLIIDTSGNLTILEDFTAPDYAESPEPGIPGTIEDLNINALQLSIAGAELTGDGAFVFDNSMGMPMPTGVANLMLTGGNGLLDTLVGMGLVPEEQATGVRMMLGLFARPGEGEDTLQSTIEMKEDGSVLANGQRIR
ncbi:MAG: DUF2125 domain-containing protein [Boseongicola sp.]|nr:DUF2125 domain-containing protein [Boseongicola sp.]